MSFSFNAVLSKTANYKNTKFSRFFEKFAKNETLQATVVIFLLVTIFLSTPLLASKDHYYSAADFLQPYSLTQIDPNPQVKNGLLGDPTVIIGPWYIFNRENVLAGKIPLWNPYNGNGVPHLANYQSSIFSPFNIPLYIFTLRQALIIIAFLKLYSLGLFTYLFLRKIALRHLPALLGGIAFMFSGTVTLWLGYPLPGAIIILPAGMYFTQTIFSKISAKHALEANTKDTPRLPRQYSYFWPLVGLSLSLVAGVLGGHPEIFYFSFLPVGAYILYHLILLWTSLGFKRTNFLYTLKIAGQFVLAGFIALGLCSIQLLPFLEYLVNSTVLSGRDTLTAGKDSLPGNLWVLQAIPNLLGNPTLGFTPVNAVGGTNYIEANTVDIGSLMLLLAILSLYFFRRDKYIKFFGIVAGVWIIYAYNIFGLGVLFRIIPGLTKIPVSRSQPIWVFCLSCCAAIFLNYVLNRKIERNWAWAFAILISGLIFLTIIFIGIQQLISSQSALILPFSKNFLENIPGQIAYFVITFIVGLIAVAGLLLTRTKLITTAISGILIAIVFLQGGVIFKDFYPSINDRYFYPVTGSIKQIQQTVGNKTLAIIGSNNMIADTNMVYKISLPSSYDGVWIKYFDQLYRQMFSDNDFNRTGLQFSERSLQLFGIDYIALPESLFNFGKDMFQIQARAGQEYYVGEILSGADLTQTFKSTFNNLQNVTVILDPLARSNNCRLNFILTEVSSGRQITRQEMPCNQVATNNKSVTFNFEPITDSKDKQYKITLSSPDSRPGNALTAIGKSDLNYPDGQLLLGNKSLKGGLNFGYTAYNMNAFKPVAQLNNLILYKYDASLSKYHFVNNAVFTQSDEEAFQTVQKSDFDPAKTVIVDGKAAGNGQSLNLSTNDAKVSIISEEADRIKLQVTANSQGYLVLANSFYPGWKAKVNGREMPVLRVNYAFSGIEITDPNSTIEFYYDPNSFRYGWYVGLATTVFGLGLIVIRWLKRYRYRN